MLSNFLILMDKKLTPEEFTNIFVDSLPNLTSNIQEKAFNYCVENLQLPSLLNSEKECLKNFTKRYLNSLDYSLIYFSKKLL